MILTLLIFIPLSGLVILPFLRGYRAPALVTLLITLVNFAVSLVLWRDFDPTVGGFQFAEYVPFLPDFGIAWKLGIDGVSLWMTLLTTFLFPMVVLGGMESIRDRPVGYYASLLVLETGVIGAFVALDLFVFYTFWEVMLVPMFFIIGIWGGENRVYATLKFVLFTMIGSLLMLVAILYLAYAAGSFDYEVILAKRPGGTAGLWLFAAFALAFLIKVPVVPVHTWLPDAHTEAPAGGSVILAGVLLKLGCYGLIRFNLTLFPDASYYFAPALCIIAVIGIVHGAMTAAVQPDMKRLIAYSSVSHMGFIVLGIFTFSLSGLQGGVLQMINHALSTGALFFLIGMVYDRTHTRLIADYGGIARVMPVFAVVFLIATLSSAGLPGLNGFIGEYVILLSTFQAYPVLGAIAVSGVVLGAWYLFKLYGAVFFGAPSAKLIGGGGHDSHGHGGHGHDAHGGQAQAAPAAHGAGHALKDLNLREIVTLLPLLFFMFTIGVAPGFILNSLKVSLETNIIAHMRTAAPLAETETKTTPVP